MARTRYAGNGGSSIFVLYKIINSESDGVDSFYNCFQMPHGPGPTLNSIKHHCVAAHSLSHLGPEGYHWRVLVEDKSGTGAERTFSWWDIQDGNAKLPVKETSQYELRKLLCPSKPAVTNTDSATKAAKGAFKMMGKAMASAIGDEGGVENQGPPVSVMIVKLLDLLKINDKYSGVGHVSHDPIQNRPRRSVASAPKSRPAAPQLSRNNAHPRPPAGRQTATRQQPQRKVHPTNPSGGGGNLMDFEDTHTSTTPASRVMHHAVSAPSATNPNETRAQRLKREQEARMKKSNRVWDDIDQRWVEVGPKTGQAGGGVAGSSNAGAPPSSSIKRDVGIKLDMSNAAGKSAAVQKAMSDRMNEMEASRQKAVAEVKQREANKKQREDEEDKIRLQLEPKIKVWSEEHGKKKQLQALLASLHTILWNGAKWKPINIGDILQPSKCKKFYFKATLVVHPDKTHDLPAEQRFLAKRIFDALSQAKSVWDESQGK